MRQDTTQRKDAADVTGPDGQEDLPSSAVFPTLLQVSFHS